jgi:hypothetical protein
MCIKKRRPTQTAFSWFEVSEKHSEEKNSNSSYILKVTQQNTMLMHFCTLPSLTHICKCHHFLEFCNKALIPVLENVKFVRNLQKYLGRKAKSIYLKMVQFLNSVLSISKYTSPQLWSIQILGLFGALTLCFLNYYIHISN